MALSLALALGVPLGAIGTAVERFTNAGAASISIASVTRRAGVPPRVVDECNRLARQAPRDSTRVLHDSAVARIGAAAGTVYGLSEENRKSDYAVASYRLCMARRGWY
jgi:hypothetical protein